MNYIATGTIKNVDGELLFNKLKVSITDLKGKARVFGYDIELENDLLEFYINTYDEVEYQIDISSSDLEVLLRTKELVQRSLVDMNVMFDICYRIEDEDGEELESDIDCFYHNPLT